MCFNNILFEHTETRMNKKIKNPETDHLFQAILTLKNLDECYAFFEDVCTVNELQSIAQRFEVAAMLRQKNTPAHCSNALGPNFGTFLSCAREVNLPFSSR